MLTSLLIAHLIACFWLVIGGLPSQENQNWLLRLTESGYQTQKWIDKYTLALYWAVVTTMTVGYGDILPTNRYEILFSSITIMFGCVVYAYNLNTIGIVLEKIYKESNIFKNNLFIITNFMERKKINYDLKMRIEEYLKFVWNEKKNKNLEEEVNIINSLSSNLREELLLEAYGGILKAYPMFYANFSESSLKKMVSILKEATFTNEEIIFSVK